ncbi:uncharacterized protein BROUX77_004229 [Berkeleyomyces rouxiae]|uniref:uncharacterized protein n=1 Tax=Berkeleyomyces rouxiae TaxID=2035830 RepID=UPI003B786620
MGPYSDNELAIVRPLHDICHLLGFAESVPEHLLPSYALATVTSNRPQPKYTLMVVDDATRYKWIDFLKTKQADEVLDKMSSWPLA